MKNFDLCKEVQKEHTSILNGLNIHDKCDNRENLCRVTEEITYFF